MDSNTRPESDCGKAKDTNVKIFSASWDRAMWIFNSFLIALIGGLTLMLLVISLRDIGANMWHGIFMLAASALPSVILILMAAFAPRQYKISAENILITRLFAKDIKIPLAKIYSAEPVSYKYAFKKSIRIMGSGGGFGIYGTFSSPGLDKFKAYMTRRDKLVLIRTTGKPFVLTPDDPEEFTAAIKKSI